MHANQRVSAAVVERRPPARVRRLVARLARRREPRRRVVGARGALVGRAVTAVTVSRRALIDVVLVAGRAGLRGMHANERVGAAVVERRPPARVRRPVAGLARGRKSGGRVVRAGGALVGRTVTAVTVSRRALVDVVLVARDAGLGGVHPGERIVRAVLEAGLRERGVRRLVAELALRREPGGLVRRLRRGLVLLRVARVARRAAGVEAAVRMATVAAQRAVRRTQRRACCRAVIPRHRGPADRPVAGFTVGAKPRPVRVVLAPDPVAVVALVRGALHRAADVAVLARHAEVPAFEIEAAGLVKRA